MEVPKSQYNLTFHLKVIYTFLILNVTLCTFCLYLLFSRHSDSDRNGDSKILLNGKFNVTADRIQREKRETNGPYYRSSDGFLQQCTALSNLCRQQTASSFQEDDNYARSRRLVDERGRPGPPGPPGPEGKLGEKGEKGDKGEKGHQGLLGFPGFKGLKGPKGDIGQKGDPGNAGPSGLRGATGPSGAPGPAGIQGPPGKRGRKGNDGLPGGNGNPGLMGPQGPPGIKGQKGEIGIHGLSSGNCSCGMGQKGDKGSRGQLGYTGYKGDKGDMGEKGEPGFGNRGYNGGNGVVGPKGSKGEKGSKGDTVVITSTDNDNQKVRNRKFLPEINSEDRKAPLSHYKDAKARGDGGNNSSNLNASMLPIAILQVLKWLLRTR